MWALLNADGTAVERVVSSPIPLTVGGVQHPSTIFRLWSKKELAAVGVRAFRPFRIPADRRAVNTTYEIRKFEVIEVVGTLPREAVPVRPEDRLSETKGELADVVEDLIDILAAGGAPVTQSLLDLSAERKALRQAILDEAEQARLDEQAARDGQPA